VGGGRRTEVSEKLEYRRKAGEEVAGLSNSKLEPCRLAANYKRAHYWRTSRVRKQIRIPNLKYVENKCATKDSSEADA